MGADLYINSIYKKTEKKYEKLFNKAVEKRNALPQSSAFDKEREKAQKEVTKYYNLMYSKGYFRDSYNGTAIARYLGFSWWQDITPLQDQNGWISPDKCIDFLHIVLSSDLKLPTKEELIENHCQVDETGEDSVEAWHKYLTEKRQKLIDFICEAIETNEGIQASL